MKKRLVWALAVLLALSTAQASVIADYPTVFFKDKAFTATIVTSRAGGSAERVAANLVINDLHRVAARRGLKSSAIRASRTAGAGDEIVIGTPCGNLRVRELLKIPARQCRTGLKDGLLKMITDEHVHLIIAGPDGDRVLDAAKVLTDERQRTKLKLPSARVVRRLYQKYSIVGSERFLDIGQTIGAETPALYTGYPYITYRPFNEYTGTGYGAIVTAQTSRQRAYVPVAMP